MLQKEKKISTTHSMLYLVDTASCERPSKTGNPAVGYQEGVLLKGQFGSLKSSLKNIFNNSTEDTSKDCKLTRILKPVLDPTCKVVFFANVVESIDSYEETLNVLSYAESLKRQETFEKSLLDEEDIIKQEDQKFRKMSQENSMLKSQLDRTKRVK